MTHGLSLHFPCRRSVSSYPAPLPGEFRQACVGHIVLLGRGVQQATMLLKASDALRPPAEIRDAYARLLGERRAPASSPCRTRN